MTVIGGVLAILKMVISHRAMMELKKSEADARDKLASAQVASQERAARQAREASEREAERDQKEKLFHELQTQTARVLQVLEAELKSQQITNARAFELLERNTLATQKLAEAATSQSNEMRIIAGIVAELKGGAGCRALPGRLA